MGPFLLVGSSLAKYGLNFAGAFYGIKLLKYVTRFGLHNGICSRDFMYLIKREK